MKLLSVSLKNMARYRTRSVITVVAVTVSVFISIVCDGFLRGIFDLSTYNLLSCESSEVTVYREGYFEKRNEYPDDIFIERDEGEKLFSILDENGYDYAPRYKTAATLLYWNEEEEMEMELQSLLVGVDPEKDGSVYGISSSAQEGKWLEKGEDGVAVGSKIAEKLGVTVGDFITLSVSGRDGFREVLDEEIVAIINSENPSVNKSEVFMDLSVLDSYLILDGGVSEVSVSDSKAGVAGRSFAEKIEKLLPSSALRAYYYEDVNSDLMAIMNGDKGSSIVMLVFLFIIAAAGISNTMIMAAMERQRESAMMRCLGFSRRSVTLQFVFEGFLSGVIGSLIGMIFALAVLYPLSVYGIDISGLVNDSIDFGYRVPLTLKAGFFVQSFVTIPLLAVLFSALSAFFPIRHYGRTEIAELLRRA